MRKVQLLLNSINLSKTWNSRVFASRRSKKGIAGAESVIKRKRFNALRAISELSSKLKKSPFFPSADSAVYSFSFLLSRASESRTRARSIHSAEGCRRCNATRRGVIRPEERDERAAKRRRSVNAASRRVPLGCARLARQLARASRRACVAAQLTLTGSNGCVDGRRPQTLRKESPQRQRGGLERSGGGEAPSARSVSPIVVLVARNGHREHSLTRRKVRHIASRPSLCHG